MGEPRLGLWIRAVFLLFTYRIRFAERGKKGQIDGRKWLFFEILMFSKKKCPKEIFFVYIRIMKNLFVSISLAFLLSACGSDAPENNAFDKTAECKCDCGKSENAPEIKEEPSKVGKIFGEVAKIGGAAVAGAVVANKLKCDRFDIEIEYLLLDACLNTCEGVAPRDSRLKKCARAIQDMECSEKLGEADIRTRVGNSCPIQ